MAKVDRLSELPKHLRGPTNNRWGGQKSDRIRGFKGTTYGPASKCRMIEKDSDVWAEVIKTYCSTDSRTRGSNG